MGTNSCSQVPKSGKLDCLYGLLCLGGPHTSGLVVYIRPVVLNLGIPELPKGLLDK